MESLSSDKKKIAQKTYVKDSLGRAFDEIKQKNSSNTKFQSLDGFLMECWYWGLNCRSVFVDTITGKFHFIIPIDTRPATVKLRLTKQAESLRQRQEKWQRLNIFLYIIDDLIAIIKLNGKTKSSNTASVLILGIISEYLFS